MKSPAMKSRLFKESGYSLVELMIVVGTIAIIAGIAMPAWFRAREDSRSTAVINEIRLTSEAFENYATDNNNNFPSSSPDWYVIPGGMASYMPQNNTWTTTPPGGGAWSWINQASNRNQPVNGYSYILGLYGSGLQTSSVQQIDSLLDDGNLATGAFWCPGDPPPAANSWIFYGIQ